MFPSDVAAILQNGTSTYPWKNGCILGFLVYSGEGEASLALDSDVHPWKCVACSSCLIGA
eukprot:14222680-Ditylum_brightwellii.AAC.1